MHTPGPWSFDGHGINAADGRRLVTFQKPPAIAPRDVWIEWIEFIGEIGHTLAAAPELLEALEKIADIEREKMDGRIKEYSSYDMEWAIAIARQAVNKVKGG